MAIEKTSIIQRGEDYIFNIVDGELVMMNINTGLYLSINETGKAIWEILTKPASVNLIINEIGKIYNVSPEQCEADVISFIADLTNRKVIIEAKS
ncbi:PqqD family peptide modification chaperone [Pedobacter sp. MC2016-14]|uniref:PqqD family peptide modification chaperone n=1 Tax=Pedobacter sp. MC2016-14 TaxID=2897327 RepID=UPI001E4ACDC7|nr:PqqD family peptide modification chaperone [Pedobacter sp. MC2016-14]MCD0486920.1 PqqD family peptide modification chaperone [Pedobacter sp. MC2016-14]